MPRGFLKQSAFEALPEDWKKEYAPHDGPEGDYILRVTETPDSWAFENVGGLRSSLQAVRNELSEKKQALSKWDGVDRSEYHKLMSRKREMEEWKPDDDVQKQIEQAVRQHTAELKEKHEREVAAERERAKSADGRYSTYRRRAEADSAIARYAPKSMELLRHPVMAVLGVVPGENGTDDQVVVLGEDGKPRISQRPNQHGHMTAEEYVGDVLRKDERYQPAFPSSGTSGTGSPGTGNANHAKTGTGLADIKDPVERLRVYREQQASRQ